MELKSGESFRGELHDAEDNWNVQLSNVTATARDGKVSHMEHVFVRGSQIRFLIIPDMLKNAPMASGPLGGGGVGGVRFDEVSMEYESR